MNSCRKLEGMARLWEAEHDKVEFGLAWSCMSHTHRRCDGGNELHNANCNLNVPQVAAQLPEPSALCQ